MPGGVINTHEDSDDADAYSGEQKEIAMEMQELRVAQHWVNQEGWDALGEGIAVDRSGREIDLRLNWTEVKKGLGGGGGARDGAAQMQVDEDTVLCDFALGKLDPTQRAFADRVLAWAAEVVRVYKDKAIAPSERLRNMPKLRAWLCGSAGSGKSTTLKTTVRHVRLLLQRENVDASIELTAYTGVAAFNIGLGARTAVSSFRIYPNAPWKKDLAKGAGSPAGGAVDQRGAADRRRALLHRSGLPRTHAFSLAAGQTSFLQRGRVGSQRV